MVYIYNLSFKLTKFQEYSLSLIKHHKHSKTSTQAHMSFCLFSRCVYACCIPACSVMSDSATSCTVAHQGSSFHGIFQARILEWVAISSPGELSYPGIKCTSPASPELAGGSFTTEPPRSMCVTFYVFLIFHGIRFSVVFTFMIMTLLSTLFSFFRIDCRWNESTLTKSFLSPPSPTKNHWELAPLPSSLAEM